MSDRIDEYHGAEAKVLTTDEVERWQEFLGDGIQLRRTLATTRALETLESRAETLEANLRASTGWLDAIAAIPEVDQADGGCDDAVRHALAKLLARAEKAEAEFDSARFARDRYANTIGQIESAVGFSGANPVEETIERVRGLRVERDTCAAELADRYDAKWLLERKGRDQAEADRDIARATVAELMTALQSIVTGYEGEDEDFGASVYEIARAVLAKAKGGGT